MCFSLSTLAPSCRTDQLLHSATFRDIFLTCLIVSKHVYFDFCGDDHKIALLRCMCIHVQNMHNLGGGGGGGGGIGDR